ncbi:MAG: oligosaccharide flippase family protein [Gloeotrichia echinulata DVL01]|nr:oligosaccharide flippase family protein [Gloeotrichia echinulata DEX184]
MTVSNSKKIVKASLWITVSFGMGKVAQLIAQAILARLLSPEDFGIWAMVLVLSNFSLLFRDTTIAQVLVQRGLDDSKLVNIVYSIGVNVSIILFFIQVLAGFPLSYFFNKPILCPLTALSAFVFLIGAGAGSHTAILQRKMKFKELAICDMLANFSRVSSLVISSMLGWGFWSFAIGEIAMALVDSLLKRFFSQYEFKYLFHLEKSKVNEIKEFIFGVLGSKIAVQLNITGDNLIVGKLLGTQSLGYYSVAYQLATTPAFAFSQINNRVIFSAISQTSEGSKEPKIKKVIEYYAITAGLIYGLAFTLTPELITLVYGNTWKQSIPICQTILIYSYMAGFMSILGAYLLSINKSLDIARIDWFIVPFSLTSYVIGANIAGIQGVAIAVTSVMGFAASTWYLIAACRSSGANIKSFLNSAFIPTISIAIVMITIHIIPGIHNANIYLKVLILLGAYIAMLTLVSKGRLPFSLIKFMFHESWFNI